MERDALDEAFAVLLDNHMSVTCPRGRSIQIEYRTAGGCAWLHMLRARYGGYLIWSKGTNGWRLSGAHAERLLRDLLPLLKNADRIAMFEHLLYATRFPWKAESAVLAVERFKEVPRRSARCDCPYTVATSSKG